MNTLSNVLICETKSKSLCIGFTSDACPQAYSNQEYITQMMDMYREAQLEPLKNMEDSLATEKATLETRIQTLTDQEKAAQEMEKQGAKDMAPDYTGQGQG